MNVEISGDIRLSPMDRLRYLVRNAGRNIRSSFGVPGGRSFLPDLARAAAIEAGQSPGRLLTELFLEAELPRMSPPRALNVLEIGCGSGSMAYRLARIGYRGTYTGIDVNDRFRRDHPAGFPFVVTFIQGDAHGFTPAAKGDLMVSVSTLEHIPADAALIDRLATLFAPGGVEVHVVPSGASLLIYLWHGFRQYTPGTLVAKFGPESEIVRLGGLGSYLLHFLFITIPDLILRRSWRKHAPNLYHAMLIAALRLDRILPFFPSAYAVIRRH
jgi:SAM-dependent methyltransferase